MKARISLMLDEGDAPDATFSVVNDKGETVVLDAAECGHAIVDVEPGATLGNTKSNTSHKTHGRS